VKKILALIAAVSLVSLTACGQANTAATLGDITITQEEVQTTVAEILAAREGVDTTQMQLETGATLNRSQLRFKIITTVFEEIAKELKIKLTTAEITKASTGLVTQSGGAEAFAKNLVAAQIAESNFTTYVRAILISDKLSSALAASGVAEADVANKISELVAAKAKELDIKVNPRYGTWDNEQGDIVAKDSAGDAVKVTE
jgi:FKBP-type peptidyl-prolyl cis-trans isomerase (trigger factor)